MVVVCGFVCECVVDYGLMWGVDCVCVEGVVGWCEGFV